MDEKKTKEQLIKELAKLRSRVTELERSETARKLSDVKLERLNLVLRAIRNVNQLITKEKDRDRLLQRACDILIETRGYNIAWIALLDESGIFFKTFEAGFGGEFLSVVERFKSGELTDCARKALKESKVVVIKNPSLTCTDCPATKKHSGKWVIVIRLESDGKVYGLLTVSIPTHLSADAEEISLLEEVTGDISFALHGIELEEERKRIEEALKESQRYTRELIEVSPDALVTISADGKVSDVNHATELITGVSRQKIIGTDFSNYFTDPDAAESGYQQVFKDNSVRDYPLEIKHIDGRVIPVLYNATVYKDAQGQIAGVFAAARDITRRKTLEAQLQQSQKMEAIGTLAGGIAHDFNNILSAITGNTEIALYYELPEEHPARQSMEQVLNASRRATNLVKQILAFSRQDEQELRQIKVTPVVKEALKLLRASLPTTIEIRQNIAAESDTVLGDPSQIHQVLMNLCTNAGHAMREEGGVLEVILQNADLEDNEKQSEIDLAQGEYLKLSVSDTGHGMEHSVLERIFDPYFTTKTVGEGTGLGLAVVHGIIKSLGGILNVQSKPGKGTTFNIFLPTIKHEATTEFDSRPGKVPMGNEHILFIDDEGPIVEIGKRMLERLGYKVTARTNSIEALELFRSEPKKFDLVITDMTMPNITGDKLSVELIKIRSDITIILCTGFSELMTEEKAKSLGIKGFVMKPVLRREMARTIREALEG